MKRTIIKITIISLVMLTAIFLPACGNITDNLDNSSQYHTRFIAHRGLSSVFFENSEAAFLAAAQSDFFWGIETDIWVTADGVWVCAHDINPFVDESLLLTDITYEQALSEPLRISMSKHLVDTASEFICSFSRYLEICAECNKTAVIELKFDANAQQVDNIISMVESIMPIEQTMFISFNAATINRILTARPDVIVQTLTNNRFSAALLIANEKNIGIRHDLLDASIIQTGKDKGFLINAWTINDIETARYFLDLEVDFITTDFIFDLSSYNN